MLDRRAQILLKTLVERYIAEGEPVGSRAAVALLRSGLSPATIRNVLADLEELGFVASPHTSAGRIPTPRGYRFFVDTLLTVKQLDRVEISQLEVNLHPDTAAPPQRRPRSFSPNSRISRRRGCKQTQDTGLPSHRVSRTFRKSASCSSS